MPNAFDVAGPVAPFGGPLVAADARRLVAWRGSDPIGGWIVRAGGALVASRSWPSKLVTRHDREDDARRAYDALRAAALEAMPDLLATADPGNGSGGALAESIWRGEQRVLALSMRPVTDLDGLVAMMSDTATVRVRDGMAALWRGHGARLVLAHGTVREGRCEHVLVASAIAGEVPIEPLVQAGLPGAVAVESEPIVRIDVSSGVLAFARASVSVARLRAWPAHGDATYAFGRELGDAVAGALPSDGDASLGGPGVFAARVRPGAYDSYVVRLALPGTRPIAGWLFTPAA